MFHKINTHHHMQRTIRARLCFGNAAMMGFVMFSFTDSQNKYTKIELVMHPSF